MAWSRIGIGVVLASVVAGSAVAVAGGGKGKPGKNAGGGAGTPEAFFADLPAPPANTDDVKKRFDDAGMIEKLEKRIPTDPPATAQSGAALSPNDPQMMDFMSGWMDVGSASAEKMYKFREIKDDIGNKEAACVDAEMARNIPDHHEGLTKCANAFLTAIASPWNDYVAATHDLVVAKADYIAKFRAKAKSAGFRAFLDGQYAGLWIHVSNTISLLEDIVNHGHVPVS